MLLSLITDIRDFLHDPDGDRWTDKQLISIINKGQIDLARKTLCMRATKEIPLCGLNTELVDLPEDLIQLTKVAINGCVIPLTTHSKLEQCSPCWECNTGIPTMAVTDRTNRLKLRFDKIPDDELLTVMSGDPLLSGFSDLGEDLYGFVVEATLSEKPNCGLGILGSMELFGTLTEIIECALICTIHYIKTPTKLKMVDSILDDEMILNTQALQHYVCGYLLRADIDTNSRALGREELNLYRECVTVLTRESVLDYNNSAHHNINYRTLG